MKLGNGGGSKFIVLKNNVISLYNQGPSNIYLIKSIGNFEKPILAPNILPTTAPFVSESPPSLITLTSPSI